MAGLIGLGLVALAIILAVVRRHPPEPTKAAPEKTKDEPILKPPGWEDGYDPMVVLVSLDGFRAEYLTRGLTPTLESIGTCGRILTGFQGTTCSPLLQDTMVFERSTCDLHSHL
jgi:hypothetical protein